MEKSKRELMIRFILKKILVSNLEMKTNKLKLML